MDPLPGISSRHEPDEQCVCPFAESHRVGPEKHHYDIPARRGARDDIAGRPVRTEAAGFLVQPECGLHLTGEETRLINTVFAIPAYRWQPTDKSEFSFYGSSAGQPAALHEWFYPGWENGFEFLHIQHLVGAES